MKTFKLIGIKLPHQTKNANGQSAKDCGNLWELFTNENIAEKIHHKLSNDIFAVYYNYENDFTGVYSYFIGCKVALNTPKSDDLDELIIPNQQYHILKAKGKMPDCVAETWRKIWNKDMKRAYGFDFEVYSEKSADWLNAEVDIYLSI